MDVFPIIIGAIVAVALGGTIFAYRDRITKLGQSLARGAASTRARLSKTVDSRYREAVIHEANNWHVAGYVVPLERIAMLPGFYTAPEPYNPLEESDGYVSPLNLIPFVPDWPQSIAPYQLQGIPLDRVLRGQDNLVVLGLPGSGRSVTLGLMAILAARQQEDNQAGGLLDSARLPVLLHAADLNLAPEHWGITVDPIQPLLAAAGVRMPGLGEQFLKAAQGQFTGGYGLVLVDGWDELTITNQRRVTEWLRVFITTYPGNKVVVAGPVRGYKALQDIGLAPTFILPWGQAAANEVADLWAESWPTIGAAGKSAAAAPDTETIRRAARGNRGRSALDITLKIWATYAGDDPGQGRRGWFSAYIDRINPASGLRAALERLGERDLATPDDIGLSLEEANAIIDAARAGAGHGGTVANADLLYSITSQTRLMVERITGRMTFTQPVIGAYLAAEGLRDAPFRDSLLDGRLESNLVLGFLAQTQDISPYVQRQLNTPQDILFDGLIWLAAWAAEADPTASWRGDVFKRLAQMMLSSAQYPLTRERVMAALAASRDPNVAFIFKEGLHSEDPRVKMISAFGLGALGDPDSVSVLGEALNDTDGIISVGATLALGAIGTKPAVDYLIQSLLGGIEMARRAAAEMLSANLAGEGHELLREALKEKDYTTRRAAIFGLQRVSADWVKPLIEETHVHDDQWLVRAAATVVLDKMDSPGDEAPKHRRGPEETEWLVQWLSHRDVDAQGGSAGILQMIRALQEGDDPTRLAAAEALASLASTEGVSPLYASLRDVHAEVRDAVYRAIGQTSLANNRPLPGVM